MKFIITPKHMAEYRRKIKLRHEARLKNNQELLKEAEAITVPDFVREHYASWEFADEWGKDEMYTVNSMGVETEFVTATKTNRGNVEVTTKKFATKK